MWPSNKCGDTRRFFFFFLSFTLTFVTLSVFVCMAKTKTKKNHGGTNSVRLHELSIPQTVHQL